MTSPFVRRRRLATELRTRREQSGMTADDLARRIFRSRMTISKLENARCRPDVNDIVKIMRILGITGDRFDDILQIACDAADRGWWDSYGDAMGPRQRMYADLEYGAATIRGYNQFGVPGILQTAVHPVRSPAGPFAKADLHIPAGPDVHEGEPVPVVVEYREGSADRHYRYVTGDLDEVVSVFRGFADGQEGGWKGDFTKYDPS